MESTGYAYDGAASEGTRSVLSYPQAAARRQVAAPWQPDRADPPRGALAAVRLWQYLNTYRIHVPTNPHSR